MANDSILAPAQTAGDSTDFTVADGDKLLVGMYVASGGNFHADSRMHVMAKAPPGGQPNIVWTLRPPGPDNPYRLPVLTITGPFEGFLRRPDLTATGVDVGGLKTDGLGSS